MNDAVVQTILSEPSELPAASVESASDTPSEKDQDDNHSDPPSPNQGQLILDATCAPADIRYPTDLDLLNEAREQSEQILDDLYAQIADTPEQKPRTYRRLARKAFLVGVKKRKASRKQIRKGIRKQLNYLRRNLAHIDD